MELGGLWCLVVPLGDDAMLHDERAQHLPDSR
jgi:hypothetical protein